MTRRCLVSIAALVGAVSTVVAVPARAQTPTPVSTPAPRTVSFAGAGDARGYVPPRAFPPSGVALQPAGIPVTFAPEVPAAARTAIQAGLAIWNGLLTSSQPITVKVNWVSLPAGNLGFASFPLYYNFTGAPVANTWYPSSLAEALSGTNLTGADFDVTMDLGSGVNWYYGTDGNTPSGQFDLVGLTMHELGHGLGFATSMSAAGATGTYGTGTPSQVTAYDRFLEDAGGTRLVNYTNNSVALRTALTSGEVYFDSPTTNRSNLDRPKVYAPASWAGGSSIIHLDEPTFPAFSANSLMTPQLNSAEAVHTPGPIGLCMLEAMGWQTAQTCTPPQLTVQNGTAWFTSGLRTASGPAGTTVGAYAAAANPAKTYKLVSGIDGGAGRPCMWDVQAVNANNRFANSAGTIGTTSGVMNRPPGLWQICFQEQGSGEILQNAGPLRFTLVA